LAFGGKVTQATLLSRQDVDLAVRAALWAALMAVGAYVTIPLGPVPLTLQTFFIVLCGFVEGPRAFIPAAIYVLAGLVGLPVFAGGTAGPGVFLGPTAGYVLSFPFAAMVAGFAAKRPSRRSFIAWGLLAMLIIHGSGVIGIRLSLSLSWAKSVSVALPFIPGDLGKCLAAALLANGYLRRFSPAGQKGRAL
jgi:biotin transport system substrate-specific component